MILARADQTLEEHINSALQAFEELKRTKFWKFVAEAEEVLRIAIIFHDSGKIFYQSSKNIENQNPSFLGHEIFSTYILNDFLYELSFEEQKRLLAEAIVFYHHYAMGIKSRIEKFKQKFPTFPICSKEELRDVLEEHEKIVLKFLRIENAKNAMEKLKEKIEKQFELNNQLSPIFACVEQENTKIWAKFQSEKAFRKLMLPCVNVMTIVDYLGAKGSETKFSKVVEDFVSLYRRSNVEISLK